ncbi:hypothetical protein [Rheinheimera sp.]|uniref:hypothetical protein n=1 Tax=Rheinheimera sp. TaxID=1869214 RepID=UPI0037C68EC7
MSKVISFMEKLGASSELKQLTESEVLELLKSECDLEASLFHSDVAHMLGARSNMVCGLVAAEEHDPEVEAEAAA